MRLFIFSLFLQLCTWLPLKITTAGHVETNFSTLTRSQKGLEALQDIAPNGKLVRSSLSPSNESVDHGDVLFNNETTDSSKRYRTFNANISKTDNEYNSASQGETLLSSASDLDAGVLNFSFSESNGTMSNGTVDHGVVILAGNAREEQWDEMDAVGELHTPNNATNGSPEKTTFSSPDDAKGLQYSFSSTNGTMTKNTQDHGYVAPRNEKIGKETRKRRQISHGVDIKHGENSKKQDGVRLTNASEIGVGLLQFSFSSSNDTSISGTINHGAVEFINETLDEDGDDETNTEKNASADSLEEEVQTLSSKLKWSGFQSPFSNINDVMPNSTANHETTPLQNRTVDAKVRKRRRLVSPAIASHMHKLQKKPVIGGVYWDDVWKSKNIKWVAKTMDSGSFRPTDRQLFHRLLPAALSGLNNTCLSLVEKDERDFTLLEHIRWKDRRPSLKYPAVPEQCSFDRSSGFLCLVYNDGESCYYASGWAEDRVQAVVDGRQSGCDRRQWLHLLAHALGLMHEHDRGDALEHVSLHPRLRVLTARDDPLEYRIPQQDCAVFRQNKSDLPFDFASLLLHDHSLRPETPRMDYALPLVPRRVGDVRRLLAARQQGLSHFDQFKLRQLYDCHGEKCPQTRRSCENFGFRNERCQCVCAPGFRGKYCQHPVKADKDQCVQSVTRPRRFHLNETGCKPDDHNPFNYTIELSSTAGNRFAITLEMTSVLDLLHSLDVLPGCEHARLHFTSGGAAGTRLLCADALLRDPVTLRTESASALLVLMLQLPAPAPSGDPSAPTPAPPSPAEAVGGVRVTIAVERSPAQELTVNTTRPPSPVTVTATSTATSAASIASPATSAAVLPIIEPFPKPTPAPTREPDPLPIPTPSRPPASLLAVPEPASKPVTVDGSMAQRSAPGTSRAAVGGIAAAILVVLVATVLLAAYMLRNRGADDESGADEGDEEALVADAGPEYADGATQAHTSE